MRLYQKGMALLCALIWMFGMHGTCQAAEKFVYGQSEMGRDLICHRLGSGEEEASLLMIFGIHGFEDAFDHDGEVLTMIAQKLIAHYTDHSEELGGFCLYIVPCANPDGLLDGVSKDGFGRCNASGIDINRDFPTYWSENTSSRYRTGKEPFAALETRAIRDLVLEVKPDYALDIHGWAERSFGNGEMTQTFAEALGLKVKRMIRSSMAATWLDTVTQESMLVELPAEPNNDEYVARVAEMLVEGMNNWTEMYSK